MTRGALADRIAEATGRTVRGLSPVGSGTAGDRLHRALFEDGGHAVRWRRQEFVIRQRILAERRVTPASGRETDRKVVVLEPA